MKIYIITKGTYSDYHICAVATDEEKAKQLAELYTDRWYDARVEVFDTDSTNALFAGRIPYCVTFTVFGEVYRVARDLDVLEFEPGVLIPNTPSVTPRMYVRLYAPNETAAVKIAAEKRAEFLARKEGL